jgi:hypothetical protein
LEIAMRVGRAFAFATLAAVTCLVPSAFAKGEIDLRKIAGVYKTRFPDGFVTGETYQGENILEIVQVSKTTVYFRIHIDAYNGHMCSVSGLAKTEADNLVFRSTTDYADSGPCVLTFGNDGTNITLHDPHSACKVRAYPVDAHTHHI